MSIYDVKNLHILKFYHFYLSTKSSYRKNLIFNLVKPINSSTQLSLAQLKTRLIKDELNLNKFVRFI